MSSSLQVQSRSRSAQRWSWPSLATLLLPLVAMIAVGAANGGFFATSFGWTALVFAWATLVAICLIAPRWRLLDLMWLEAAGAVCLFAFLSATWAGSVGDAIDSGFRSLVYLTGIAGALVVLRRRDIDRWLAGLVLGVGGVCSYALATRLLPGRVGTFDSSDYRLFEPIGYWNALGIFAAIALLLALGVAALGRGVVLRAVTATSAVVVAPTLYFTFSRGAWFALAAGTVVMFALSPRRLRLICALALLGAIPAFCVVLASRAPALTNRGAGLTDARHAGHRLVLELAVLALAQAAVTVGYVLFVSRLKVSPLGRRVFGMLVVAAAIGGFAGVFVEYGSPVTIARNAYHSFSSAPTLDPNLNGRLFSLSNDGRTALWHSAWQAFKAHPVVGSGGDGFGRWWLQHRSSSAFVEDAHNLYLQTLAEFGIVGFLLLLGLLGLPLVAAVRARKNPLVAPALGGYVAFLVHAGVDWDWQMPAVTLLALFTGAALITAARAGTATPDRMRLPFRITLGAAAGVAGTIAFVGLIGSIALARSATALDSGDGRKAVTEAAKAHRWAPWSAEPLLALGQGRILAGARNSGLAALREATRDDPGNWVAWFDLAAATTGADHRAALTRALALNPYSPEISDIATPTQGGT